MVCIPKTPSKSLSPALLKVKPGREQFEQFKAKLSGLVEQINSSPNESEEHHKNHISDFLKYTFKFPAYFINTNDRIDLVIHNGKSSADTVGVIIEVKRPTNQAEMPSPDNLNVKAMQELVLYYLRDRMRIMARNLDVKHLAITNGYEWFIFDANVFEKAFAQNKTLVKQFNEFEAGRLSGNTTDFFYREIAKPAVEKIGDVEFTHFDLREKTSDKQLIALLKLFSPEHLLKIPFVNDSNSLNKDFYSELLHIIGLVETKEGSKKLIQRKNEGERNRGSLLENAITKLDAQDRLPPVVFTPMENAFKVTLYAPKKFADMAQDERIEACYQHAVLKFFSNSVMTNTSLRERLQIPEKQRAQVSRLIREALNSGRIKLKNPHSSSSKFTEYLPYWS